MVDRREFPGGERGAALVLTLMVLLILTGLAVAVLSTSAFEPRVARNHSDAVRARYLAEAGIEVGYNVLAAAVRTDTTWSPFLATATPDSPWVTLPSLGHAALPGLTTADGTYSVSIRNDWQASDAAITGEATADGTAALDGNGIVILRSSGTFRDATRTVEVVVKRGAAPPAPATSDPLRCTMSNWREI